METVANQKIIIIHREKPQKDFLQIKNENWQNMLKHTYDYPALALYMYLASNMDNYKFALSPAAIQNAIGMPRTTYYKKLQLLKDKGYIIEKQGNVLEFYEVPQLKENVSGNLLEKQDGLPEEQENLFQRQAIPQQEQECSQNNIEIDNNTNKTNIINNNIKKQEPTKKGFIF